jgi:hypothetical protein
VTCTRQGTRTVVCKFATRATRINGSRARLSRSGRTYATGTVHGRVLRLRATRTVGSGSYVLKLTRGRGGAAVSRLIAVKI